jgi:hypothetical protein
MYLLISGFLIGSLMPIYYKALELSKKSYLMDAEYALKRNAASMQKTMQEIYQLPVKMNDCSDYIKLKLIHCDSLPTEYYSKMYLSQKYLVNQMTTLDDAEEVFIFLSNNNVMLG